MNNKITEALNWRYATKKFSSKKIVAKDLGTLKESLRLAPSSFGLQPWKFIIVENKDLREKLKTASWNQGQVTDASHLFVLCARTEITEKDIKKYIEDRY